MEGKRGLNKKTGGSFFQCSRLGLRKSVFMVLGMVVVLPEKVEFAKALYYGVS